jgi:hypothetical protein
VPEASDIEVLASPPSGDDNDDVIRHAEGPETLSSFRAFLGRADRI